LQRWHWQQQCQQQQHWGVAGPHLPLPLLLLLVGLLALLLLLLLLGVVALLPEAPLLLLLQGVWHQVER
jgi:hypothetical protein